MIIPMPRLLAIDSCASITRVALRSQSRLIEHSTTGTRQAAQQLLPLVQKVLRSAKFDIVDLDGIIVAAGPGSFTGLRIGIAAAQGLSAAHSIPLIGVSSLAQLAQSAFRNIESEAFLVCLPARDGEVYFGAYKHIKGSVVLSGQEQVLSFTEDGSGSGVEFLGEDWVGGGQGWRKRSELENKLQIQLVDCFPEMQSDMQGLFDFGLEKFLNGEVLSAEELLPHYVKERLEYSP